VITEEVRPPEKYEEITNPDGPVMTNFTNMVEPGLEDMLRTQKFFGHHAAWEFFGDVWFDGEVFHESVYSYHLFQGHYTAPTLRELMNDVNDMHGWL
jgi:hypothetical protein